MLPIKSFDDFLLESSISSLKSGMVFKTTDKGGDLANKLLLAKKVSGNQITVVTPDGDEADTTLSLMNIDQKSVREYDPKKDPKYK